MGEYPPLLTEGQKCYNEDKKLECLCRCQEEFGPVLAFYLNDQNQCGCSTGECKII